LYLIVESNYVFNAINLAADRPVNGLAALDAKLA
jgi:hypothetical protein